MEEAKELGLGFEEIKGTDEFFKKILGKDWDQEFLIIKPGHEITLDMFLSYISSSNQSLKSNKTSN